MAVFSGAGRDRAAWNPSGQFASIATMSERQIEVLLQNARSWPEEDQDEPVALARDIDARRSCVYRASAEELSAIDDVEVSGIATQREVETAFATFRRA